VVNTTGAKLSQKWPSFQWAFDLIFGWQIHQRCIAAMFDVSLPSVQQWIRNYESMGADAFTLKGNKKYSKELKQQAVTKKSRSINAYGKTWNLFGSRIKTASR